VFTKFVYGVFGKPVKKIPIRIVVLQFSLRIGKPEWVTFIFKGSILLRLLHKTTIKIPTLVDGLGQIPYRNCSVREGIVSNFKLVVLLRIR